jgi:hypothetical protein
MIVPPSQIRRPGIRAAMFVDFDNVYSGLQAVDPAAAKVFAEDPKQWTSALAGGGGREAARRFLIRNCYLNPVIYSKYRAYWTRAGFRVIDCPSLTQRGKSSTDINLVLDAMDVLAGPVGIDEFVIASADADFTSLIARFRAADRITTVIAAGPVAFAYREMADHVVESNDFAAILTGSSADAGAGVLPRGEGRAPAPAPRKGAAAKEVSSLVRSSPGPVTGSVAAHRALTAEPSLKTDWGGHGKFGAWIAQLGNGIEYSPTPTPGWVWDARRFSAADLPQEAEARSAVEEHVTRVTDVPALSRAQFRQVFLSLETVLREHPPNRNELTRSVRDHCVAAGHAVSRAAVNFIIQGLNYTDALSDEATAVSLATAWTRNVEELCRLALLEFDETEVAELRRWAGGGLVKAPSRQQPKAETPLAD